MLCVPDPSKLRHRHVQLENLSPRTTCGFVFGFPGPPAAMLPWTVDCSLHPWLQKRRPLQGMLVTIMPDDRSASWSTDHVTPATVQAGDERSTSAATETVVGAGGGCRGARSAGGGVGNSRRQDDGIWTGVPLEGVWDVLENTSPRTTPHALEALFQGSGARVVRGESDGGPAGVRGGKRAYPRAKL